MRVVYVVIAHKYPRQLGRLVNALVRGDSNVFIHIDKKTDITPYRKILDDHENSRVRFVGDRVNVQWGGFSVVRSIVRSLDNVARSGVEFDHLLLMSGQCYPIKSREYIDDFLGHHDQEQIISVLSVEDGWPRAQQRIRKYYLNDYENHVTRRILRLANRILPDRNFIPGMKPYGGSLYFAVTQDCFEHMLERMKSDAAYNRFFKLSDCPAEMYFHTLIMNSEFAETVFNWNPWFIKWPEEESSHPYLLGIDDFEGLAESERLFARKFDIEHDVEILDRIDEELLDRTSPRKC